MRVMDNLQRFLSDEVKEYSSVVAGMSDVK